MSNSIQNSSFPAVTPPSPSKKLKTEGLSKGRRRRNPARAASSVQRRVRTLQRLIPGGKELPADRLFSRTADYILHLRLQVHVLQELSKIYNSWCRQINGVAIYLYLYLYYMYSLWLNIDYSFNNIIYYFVYYNIFITKKIMCFKRKSLLDLCMQV